MTLKYRCIRAARLPFFPALREERMAVIQVPTSAPTTTGIAMPQVTLTERESACRTPMVPAELWIIMVNTIPTTKPTMGLLKEVRNSMKDSDSLRGATALLIICMPNMRTAKPSRMEATFFLRSDLENIRIATPARAR